MSNLLAIALSQLGVKEIRGKEDNPTIVNYAKEAGFEWVNDDETPWCSIFLNWCTQKAKLISSGKANARSWLQVGNSTQNPVPGDIVVYWRGNPNSWTGHVGLFLGYNQNGSHIFTLGGNQGNQVSIAPYSSIQLLGFRTLNAVQQINTPKPTLKLKDSGESVKELQKVLLSLGLRVGKADGLFGLRTEEAVKVFQTRQQLEVDGIYGPKTAAELSTQLDSIKQ